MHVQSPTRDQILSGPRPDLKLWTEYGPQQEKKAGVPDTNLINGPKFFLGFYYYNFFF